MAAHCEHTQSPSLGLKIPENYLHGGKTEKAPSTDSEESSGHENYNKTQPLLKRKKHAKGATYQQRLIEIS